MKKSATASSFRSAVKSYIASALDLLRAMIVAVVLVMLIRIFLWEVYRIPSTSMLPNLEVGDFIVVSKYSYGYSRFSFPFGHLLGTEGRVFADTPQRGEVAIFRKPSDTRISFVKRIVGFPGDIVQVIGGRLYVNGQRIAREQLADYTRPEWDHVRSRHVPHYREGGELLQSHTIIELDGDQAYRTDNTNRYVVPEGHFFAMGDNRDRSKDSRFLRDVGYIPFENLVGRPEFVLFSLDLTAASGFWLRLNRFFKGIT